MIEPGDSTSSSPFRLHIGGQQPRAGWKIFDMAARPEVDLIGNCMDLGQFADGTVDEIYASHVVEHLSHADEIQRAFKEFHRVLRNGGRCCIAVPDFYELCRAFIDKRLSIAERWQVMVLIFGGQRNELDFHKIGLTYDFVKMLLANSGFSSMRRVRDFEIFVDSSTARITNKTVSDILQGNYSLNIEAFK